MNESSMNQPVVLLSCPSRRSYASSLLQIFDCRLRFLRGGRKIEFQRGSDQRYLEFFYGWNLEEDKDLQKSKVPFNKLLNNNTATGQKINRGYTKEPLNGQRGATCKLRSTWNLNLCLCRVGVGSRI